MSIVTQSSVIDNPIAAGVHTHAEVNVAAVIDHIGRELGHQSFPTTPAGYRDLHTWIDSLGTATVIGIEGTGVYGAGLARHLTAGGVHIVEVDRPTASPAVSRASPTQSMRTRRRVLRCRDELLERPRRAMATSR